MECPSASIGMREYGEGDRHEQGIAGSLMELGYEVEPADLNTCMVF